MIPTMILTGFVAGRRWAIPVGAVVWVALVFPLIDLGARSVGILGLAAALGAANVAVGVLLREGVAWLVRLFVRLARMALPS